MHSEPAERLIAEARGYARAGVRELVLVAQDSTAYDEDRAARDGLATLLEQLSAAVPEVPWIRLMYAYPGRVTARLAETMAALPNVVPYLDIPLQHGSDTMLRRMRRPSLPRRPPQPRRDPPRHAGRRRPHHLHRRLPRRDRRRVRAAARLRRGAALRPPRRLHLLAAARHPRRRAPRRRPPRGRRRALRPAHGARPGDLPPAQPRARRPRARCPHRVRRRPPPAPAATRSSSAAATATPPRSTASRSSAASSPPASSCACASTARCPTTCSARPSRRASAAHLEA